MIQQQITLQSGNNIIVTNVSNATYIHLKKSDGAIVSSATFDTLGNYNVEFQALVADTYIVETDGTINSLDQTSKPIVSEEPAKAPDGSLKVYNEYLAGYKPDREWQCIGKVFEIVAPTPPETSKQNIFDIELDSSIVGADNKCELIGGRYYIPNTSAINDNDLLEFSVIDKNDVLGLFSQYGLTVGTDILELKKFIKTHSVIGGQLVEFKPGQPKELVKGLFLRVSYTAYGTTNFILKVDFYLPA